MARPLTPQEFGAGIGGTLQNYGNAQIAKGLHEQQTQAQQAQNQHTIDKDNRDYALRLRQAEGVEAKATANAEAKAAKVKQDQINRSLDTLEGLDRTAPQSIAYRDSFIKDNPDYDDVANAIFSTDPQKITNAGKSWDRMQELVQDGNPEVLALEWEKLYGEPVPPVWAKAATRSRDNKQRYADAAGKRRAITTKPPKFATIDGNQMTDREVSFMIRDAVDELTRFIMDNGISYDPVTKDEVVDEDGNPLGVLEIDASRKALAYLRGGVSPDLNSTVDRSVLLDAKANYDKYKGALNDLRSAQDNPTQGGDTVTGEDWAELGL